MVTKQLSRKFAIASAASHHAIVVNRRRIFGGRLIVVPQYETCRGMQRVPIFCYPRIYPAVVARKPLIS